MPLAASPVRVSNASVIKPHFLIHLYLRWKACKQQHMPAFFPLSADVLAYQFPGQSLHTVLWKHIQAKQHNIFSIWVVKACIYKKLITESMFICRESIEKPSHLPRASVNCTQK